MKTFYLSDQHYGHSNIINLSKRPFSHVKEMDEFMVQKHNEVVGVDDRVIMGGDFALATFDYAQLIFNRLNGKKYLVKGNHDGSISRMLRIGFIGVFKYWYEDGVLVSHYPGLERSKIPPELYKECKIFLYGHIHEKALYLPIFKSRNMCVECNDYTPFQIL